MFEGWDTLAAFADVVSGWGVWSLAHNLGHRWWHQDMAKGRQTFYAHGEREHHRVYDGPVNLQFRHTEDPNELFISFPLAVVAPVGLLIVAAYGLFRGGAHWLPFAISMYAFMLLDQQVHTLFHRHDRLEGVLGRLQDLHLVHHRTHRHNFFFASGIVWDLLFRTVRGPSEIDLPPGNCLSKSEVS